MKRKRPKRTDSPYIKVKSSRIHSQGVFAAQDIPKDTEIIEYVGEKITKREAEKRAEIPLHRASQNKECGAVYIFELNKRYDLDGDVWYNTARFINHSCEPNCEAQSMDGHIWIVAVKNIKKGEEITYDYGYSFEDFHDHPCRCGSPNCIGYIVAKRHWHRVRKHKAKQQKK